MSSAYCFGNSLQNCILRILDTIYMTLEIFLPGIYEETRGKFWPVARFLIAWGYFFVSSLLIQGEPGNQGRSHLDINYKVFLGAI